MAITETPDVELAPWLHWSPCFQPWPLTPTLCVDQRHRHGAGQIGLGDIRDGRQCRPTPTPASSRRSTPRRGCTSGSRTASSATQTARRGEQLEDPPRNSAQDHAARALAATANGPVIRGRWHYDVVGGDNDRDWPFAAGVFPPSWHPHRTLFDVDFRVQCVRDGCCRTAVCPDARLYNNINVSSTAWSLVPPTYAGLFRTAAPTIRSSSTTSAAPVARISPPATWSVIVHRQHHHHPDRRLRHGNPPFRRGHRYVFPITHRPVSVRSTTTAR